MARNTILIVDDERPHRHVVQLVLTKAGCGVIEADNGAMAISRRRRSMERQRLSTAARIFCRPPCSC